MQHALSAAAIPLDPFFEMETDRRRRLLADFDNIITNVENAEIHSEGREHGGCWLWLTDAAHEVTRALVLSDRVHINKSGRYLVELSFDRNLALAEREERTRRVASRLKKHFGLKATYHSVLGSFDSDGVPHYSDPPFENRLIFNFGSDEGND